MTAIALNNLWNYLKGLALSQSDRKWLAEKLVEPSETEEKQPVAAEPKKRKKIRSLSPEVVFLNSLHLSAFTQEELDADPRLAAILEDRRLSQ